MLQFETYVKYSLEGMLCTLVQEHHKAKPARRSMIATERAAISANYNAFVELAGILPRFPETLFDRIFPKMSRKSELYIRIKPANATETITFLEAFDAYPLAHREGERDVYPYTSQSETHRIFPYTVIVQVKPHVLCRVVWCHECRKDRFVFIRMQLPDELTELAVDSSAGILRDSMFVAGLAPYVYVKTNEVGRQIGLHFPKAYLPIEGGRFRLLTWRDIPLFLNAARDLRNESVEGPR